MSCLFFSWFMVNISFVWLHSQSMLTTFLREFPQRAHGTSTTPPSPQSLSGTFTPHNVRSFSDCPIIYVTRSSPLFGYVQISDDGSLHTVKYLKVPYFYLTLYKKYRIPRANQLVETRQRLPHFANQNTPSIPNYFIIQSIY